MSGRWLWRLFLTVALLANFVSFGAEPALALSPSDYFTYTYSFSFDKTTVTGSETFNVTVTGQATCIQDLPVPVGDATAVSRVVAQHQSTGTEVILNPGFTVSYGGFPTKKGGTVTASVTVPLAFPAGSPAGAYTVTGYVLEAKVKVLIVWIDVTGYLPSSQVMGVVTCQPVAASGGGGGGGGFGGVDTRKLVKYVDAAGRLLQDVVTESPDSKVRLTLKQDTVALAANKMPLLDVTVKEKADPPSAPADHNVLGLAYDFGPAGATFNPPITITFTYDDARLPAGASEKRLSIAIWDEKEGKWQKLESVVDTEKNTVSAQVSHFSVLTVLVPVRPATFVTTNPAIFPSPVQAGQSTTVSLKVSNVGDLSGVYKIELKVRAVGDSSESVVESRETTLAGGTSEEIAFTITPYKAGIYSVVVGDIWLSLTVKEAEKPAPPPASDVPTPAPSPASFSFRELTVTPVVVDPDEVVVTGVVVSNDGEQAGTCEVVLMLDGMPAQAKPVTLAGKTSEHVTFGTTASSAGVHTVTVGGLSGSFTVNGPVPVTALVNWWLVGGLVGLGVLVSLLVCAVWQRKRSRMAAR